MTEKEKAIQRALGTLSLFDVKIKLILETASRQDALSESRAVVRFLREHFPGYTFKKGVMKKIND